MKRRTLLAATGLSTVTISGCLSSDDDASDESTGDDGALFGDDASDDATSDDEDSGDGGDSENGDGEYRLEGFEDCSAPDTDDLDALLPTEADVDGLSNAGSGSGTDVGVERVSRTFREGGSTDVNTVVGRVEEPPFQQNQLSRNILYADSSHAEKLAYVIVGEYLFITGGFDENHAIEMLTAFPSIDQACAANAELVDSDS
ncbi:hypothetical protein ACLI4R_00065 [Natrialbaceae archaeon A-chndr2]